MRQSTRLLLNASVNVISGLVNMAVRLVVVPLCVYYLGKEAYGVYALVAGLTLYTPYLHMGMAAAVTRYTAAHLAREEYDDMNAVVNTGVAYFRVMALLFVGATLFIAFYCIQWLISNPDLHPVARLCVVVFGIVEGLVMYIGPIGGILWAIERFDLFSIPVTVFRLARLAALAAILPWCDSESGLVVVTLVMVLTNFLPALARRILAARYTPHLKFDVRLARKTLVWPMISFGVGSITWNWAGMILDYLPLLLIGAYLTTEDVTDYQVPASALLLVDMVVRNVTAVMTPTASKWTVTGRHEELRELFLRSGKYAAGVSITSCAGMGILAPLLLYLWVGQTFLHVAMVLTLLAAGRSFLFLQSGSFYILVGMAKQRIPGIIAVTGVAVMGAAQAMALYMGWGLVAVAGVAATTLVLGWGLALSLYACRQVGVGLGHYYTVALVRPILAALPASAGWLALRSVPLSYGWITLAVALLGGAFLAGLGWWFILFDDWDRRLASEKLIALRDKLRSVRARRPLEGEPPMEGQTPAEERPHHAPSEEIH